ncbi:unnamed protein product [Gongylonema pulchrum]|uniref:Uncharacterized protein n=1 Tax=Gongylonema pulchrum TaxID=637853 RepID=A0A183EKP9_9BILA|nr:unnamed protein product [Gongylonema pulchrum]
MSAPVSIETVIAVHRSARRSAAFVSIGDVFLRGPAVYTVLAISFSNMSAPIPIETVIAVHRSVTNQTLKQLEILVYGWRRDTLPNRGLWWACAAGRKPPSAIFLERNFC